MRDKSTSSCFPFSLATPSVTPYLHLLCTYTYTFVRLLSSFLSHILFVITQKLLRGEADKTKRRELPCTGGGGRDGRRGGK